MTYTLGSGVNSVRGDLKEGEMVLQFPPAAIRHGTLNQHTHVTRESMYIQSYSDLRKKLGVDASLTATVSSVGSASFGLDFFKTTELSQTDVFILVRVRYIDHVDELKPGSFHADPDKIALLKSDRKTFIMAHGDRYINKVDFGKELIALVRFRNANQKQAHSLKARLDAKINIPSTPVGGEVQFELHDDEELDLDSMDVEVKIDYRGFLDGATGDVSDIDSFQSILQAFEKPENNRFEALTYASQPYVTVIHENEAAALDDSIMRARFLLNDVDKALNRLRFMTHTISSVLDSEGVYVEQEVSALNLVASLNTLETLRRHLQELALDIEGGIPEWNAILENGYKDSLSKLQDEVISHASLLDRIYNLKVIIGTVHSNARNRVTKPFHHAHSSDYFDLPNPGRRYLFWEVQPTHPNAQNVTFDVGYKDAKHHYHTLFHDVSGAGCKNELPSDFPRDYMGFSIYNPKGAGKEGFVVLVSETDEAQSSLMRG